jgi:hypothetical protein
MSWSSDIRCLYCDGKLPLYRKITNGQFCSAAHRKLYWQEQERLGVERLHQTHDSLRAFRPREAVEAILGAHLAGQAKPEVPPPSGIIAPPVVPKYDESPAMIAPDPFAYEADLSPQTPFWAPQIAADLETEAPAAVAGFVPGYALPQPRWPLDILETPEPTPMEPLGTLRMPLRPATSLIPDMRTAGIATVPVAPRHYEGARRVEPVSTVMLPCRDVSREACPAGNALAGEEDIPRAEKLMALAGFTAREDASDGRRREPWPAGPFTTGREMHLPLRRASAAPALAGLRPLSIDQVPLVHGTWIDNLRAMGSEGESPRYELSTPALRPRLRLAAGSRYPVATRDPGLAVATAEPQDLPPSARVVSIPERKAMAAGASAASAAPSSAGLLPLDSAKPNEPAAQKASSTQSPNLPQPLRTEPMRPESHLEPLDGKPIEDFMATAPTFSETKDKLAGAGHIIDDLVPPSANAATAATALLHLAGFWKNAPRDLKLLVFGIPILLALALHPSLKKISYTAPQQAGGIQRNLEHNFQTKLNDQWLTVKQTMVDRAAIALDEDFRAGLDDWTSRGGTTEWAFDATGFVRPGPLALYRPSLDLTDYQLQFLGMIDKKALSWVVRAADFDDYYVVKLVVLNPGPLPTIGVTRYAVIHGQAQNRGDTIAYINAREDMLYRVRMDIHGDTFALTVQGQLVDSWSEPRLRKGGVGFFTSRGEASRLRWVQVTHQYDMLGRLCAYLAPYNIPSTNGGWQP